MDGRAGVWLLVGIAAANGTMDDISKPASPGPSPLDFGFSPVFGDYMVLQQAPSAAAVYGVLPTQATGVVVSVSDGRTSYEVTASVGKQATHQPVGYVDPSGVPLPVLNNTWKAVLKPNQAGGDFTITAKCTGCPSGGNGSAVLAHVTFGDMWYCSGQSNMWLPVHYSFSRNATVAAIGHGKYSNIRGMFSPSATTPTAGKWMTVEQAIQDGNETNPTYSLFDMGATCWYFAQTLAEKGVTTPIGIADTAIGGQRIEEFLNNGTYKDSVACPDEIGGTEIRTVWNGQLFAKQVMPFVDMTVKGWLWYQGENNMMNVKGNSAVNVGYSCKQRELIKGWRSIWSESTGTTDPQAPFGIVTLASSGTEGGPNLGAMRIAQTAGYGVVPNNALPNAFFAQAGDLEDEWGPAAGPCFSDFESQWACCDKGMYTANRSSSKCQTGTKGHPELCDPACAAAAGTPSEGGIHPRSKYPVGSRLGIAAYNSVYGGSGAITGPTLSGCSVDDTMKLLRIEFNTTLLASEKVVLSSYNKSLNNEIAPDPPVPSSLVQCYDTVKQVCGNFLHNYTDCRNCKNDATNWAKLQPECGSRPINNFHEACKSFFPAQIPLRGSLMEVLVGRNGADGAAAFCSEPLENGTTNTEYCPPWAGPPATTYDSTTGSWIEVDIVSATASSVSVDLSQLAGKTIAGVRYSWGVFDCCNTGDPTLFVSRPCNESCPITSTSSLPANPFIAKIIDGSCSCIDPQIC